MSDLATVSRPDQRRFPRRLARTPSPPEIVSWWRREYLRVTGQEATGNHRRAWWRIFEYLAVNPQLRMADLELVVVGDERWVTRRNRTRREKLAWHVASICPHGTERKVRWCFFVLPRVPGGNSSATEKGRT